MQNRPTPAQRHGDIAPPRGERWKQYTTTTTHMPNNNNTNNNKR